MPLSTAQVQQAYVTFFSRPADPVGLAYWQAYSGSVADLYATFAQQAEYSAAFNGLSSAQRVNVVYQNLFGRDAEASGLLYWAGQLEGGKITVANLALAVSNGAQTTDKVTVDSRVSAATSFTAALDTPAEILGYSGTTANAAAKTWLAGVTTAANLATAVAAIDTSVASTVAVGGAAGSTFTLTTGVDTTSGTAGNDSITSSNSYTDGAIGSTSTISAADTVTGGLGDDTLNLVFEGDYANNTDLNVAAATITGVETIKIRSLLTADGTGDTLTFDTGNATGETTVASDRSTSAVAFTNVAAGTKVQILGNASATGNVSAGYSAAGSTVALEVSGGTRTSTFTVTSAQTGTSAAITSVGASNSMGAIDFGSATLLKTATINATTAFLTTDLGNATDDFAADAAVTISGASADVAASSSAAARAAVSIGTLDSNIKTVTASGLTAGGVALTLSGAGQVFTGGAGNDQVTTGADSATGIIDAGAGSLDRLTVAVDTHLNSTLEGSVYKGFEVLAVADDAEIDMDNVTGSTIGAVVLSDAGNVTAITDMTATQAANVTIAALAGAATLGIKNATTVGNNDTLKITVTDGDTTASEAVAGTGNLTIAGVETIEITAIDDITLASMANITGVTSLKVSGDADVSITSAIHVVTTNMSVDFSGLTKASTFDFSGATTAALAFTGGSGVDTVTTSVFGGNVIKTGLGKDVITLIAVTGGTTATEVTAGAGADTVDINLHEGNDAGDRITLKYAAGDSISVAGSTYNVNTTDNTDTVSNISNDEAAAAAAGNVITFDTVEAATAVTFSTSAVVLGTTTVTNAFDFYVFENNAGVNNSAVIYQDTDGDKILEAGEFAVYIVGAAQFATGEFAISSGNLVLTTA
jgi:hypothetical protein